VFNQVKCISGSTILGSGEVALILDVPQLVHEALASAAAARPARALEHVD
jgi:two-component system chemotaxis sensor kinase CheA